MPHHFGSMTEGPIRTKTTGKITSKYIPTVFLRVACLPFVSSDSVEQEKRWKGILLLIFFTSLPREWEEHAMPSFCGHYWTWFGALESTPRSPRFLAQLCRGP
jgi:hypothetical protein